MDRKLMSLPHIDGDLAKVNIDPVKRVEILQRYGQPDTVTQS
jgi:alkane 1-monooxygenase